MVWGHFWSCSRRTAKPSRSAGKPQGWAGGADSRGLSPARPVNGPGAAAAPTPALHCPLQAPGAGGSARAAGTLREPAPFPERPLTARRGGQGTRSCSRGPPTEASGAHLAPGAAQGTTRPPRSPRGPGPAPARPAPHSPRAAAAAVTSASIPRRPAEVTSRRRERFLPVRRGPARPGSGGGAGREPPRTSPGSSGSHKHRSLMRSDRGKTAQARTGTPNARPPPPAPHTEVTKTTRETAELIVKTDREGGHALGTDTGGAPRRNRSRVRDGGGRKGENGGRGERRPDPAPGNGN